MSDPARKIADLERRVWEPKCKVEDMARNPKKATGDAVKSAERAGY